MDEQSVPSSLSIAHIQHLKREGTTQISQSSIDKDTEKKLEEISQSFDSKVDDVVQLLIDRVVLVKAEPHRNLKKAGGKQAD